MNISIPGNGWWAITFSPPGKMPVSAGESVEDRLEPFLTEWIGSLAAGKAPDPIILDRGNSADPNEPDEQEPTLSLTPTDNQGWFRLVMTRFWSGGQPTIIVLDELVEARDFASELSQALWRVGWSSMTATNWTGKPQIQV